MKKISLFWLLFVSISSVHGITEAFVPNMHPLLQIMLVFIILLLTILTAEKFRENSHEVRFEYIDVCWHNRKVGFEILGVWLEEYTIVKLKWKKRNVFCLAPKNLLENFNIGSSCWGTIAFDHSGKWTIIHVRGT